MKALIACLSILLFSSTVFGQKFENLAPTPPMGWNSWNHFACDINEQVIRDMADAMVASGLQDAGYEYINIDDCWHGPRDELGFITADPERFPSGMKALADYVHSKGLKLGIYSDAGWTTCAGRPGSRGYEFQDAMTYAEWGIDYLKYDWCATDGLNGEGAYMTIRNALAKAGRPIVLSICEWGHNKPWDGWGEEMGQLWRTTGDIIDCFDCEVPHDGWSSWGIMKILDMQEPHFREAAGPNHWNDPDMMEVGNAMSTNEDRAHFSIWCMLAAPLIAGNDLTEMTQETIDILTNKGAISINQDELGVQGFKYSAENELEIWFKPLADGKWAVCFLNRASEDQKVNFNWKEHPIADEFADRHIDFKKDSFEITDVWSGEKVGSTKKAFKATVPSHDVRLLILE